MAARTAASARGAAGAAAGTALVAALAGALLAATGGSRPAAAQGPTVLLRLMPRVGDTLRTRFEQVVEMSAPARGDAPGGEGTVTRQSTMLVLSRSIVERADDDGAVVSAVTDSVAFSATGADPRALDATRRALLGRRARLHVSPAGASEVVGGDGATPAAGPTHGRFPGTLPTEPVAVGATWTRELPLPWGGADRPGGKLQVVFRLDSVVAALAYVSMRGALSRGRAADGTAARVATSGTFAGALLVDLHRGWMTDSRSTFVMTSVVAPAGGRGVPARVKLKVTQRLRAR